jgi:hypothetical protein
MAKKQKKFKDQILIKEEGDGDNKFFCVYNTPEDVAEVHGDVKVGVYKLVRVAKVKTKIVIEYE